MNKTVVSIITAAISFLPLFTALLFFSGDTYHQARLVFWGADPSMFPMSVPDKVSLGARVLADNITRSIVGFAVAYFFAFLILIPSSRLFDTLSECINLSSKRLANRFFKKKHKSSYRFSESEKAVYVMAFLVYSCVVLSGAFSYSIKKVQSASQDLAKQNQTIALQRLNCSFKGVDACKKLKLDSARLSTFSFENGDQETGHLIACTEQLCVIYLNPGKIVQVAVGQITRTETAPPNIKQ